MKCIDMQDNTEKYKRLKYKGSKLEQRTTKQLTGNGINREVHDQMKHRGNK